MDLLQQTLDAIEPPDEAARKLAAKRLDSLTKPPGSLGRLEEFAMRYAAIRRDGSARFGRAVIMVFVADHGIADAAVSAYPKAVTAEMLRNIGAGGAAISVLAASFGYGLVVTDVGVEVDTSTAPLAGVRYCRIAPGTRNFLAEPAMEPEQARRAITIGIEAARRAAAADATLLGIGEMGIGNSTSAAAILSALTGIAPERIAGRGTGVDDAGFARKLAALNTALRLHGDCLGDGLQTLSALGGFEIGAMAGVCLGAAALHVPVVVDGFIATAAAAIADRLWPGLREQLFFAHRSAEGGHALVLEKLGVRPMFDLDLRLGEGTGAALAMKTIESALALFHRMATFETAGVSGTLG